MINKTETKSAFGQVFTPCKVMHNNNNNMLLF